MATPLVIWTIAGFDPSSGAGVTADLKTISALGCYGAACITALTVQNTLGVRRVEPIASGTIAETLQALLEDLPPAAIKIGMIGSAAAAEAVACFLERLPRPRCPVVIDPILRSSSGAELLDAAGLAILRRRLLPLAAIVTPNRAEAALLTGLWDADAEQLAQALLALGSQAGVVTGGDAAPDEAGSDTADDTLAYRAGSLELTETLSAPRIASAATHGTGCAFSTAIACALAHGENVPTAVTMAKAFVRQAIQRAPGVGHGKGPMGLERAGRD